MRQRIEFLHLGGQRHCGVLLSHAGSIAACMEALLRRPENRLAVL
jgi:hypothetical protein